MAQAIAEKLSELDPQHAEGYHRNLQTFLTRLEAKIPEWQQRLAPFKDQEIIAYHNEWPYLMRFVGLKTEHFLEPKPGIPPTPQQLEFIQQYAKVHPIRALVQAPYFPTQAANVLAKRTGMKVVMLCQNVHELPEASDYLSMVEYNVQQLIAGLQP